MRQALSKERSGELCAILALSLSSSGLHDRIFRKYRLAAPERFVDRRLRRHPIVYHIVDREGEHVLGADLRPCRIVHFVNRDRWTVDALPGIGLERLVLRVEPERLVVLDDRRHGRQKPAEPSFQIGTEHLWLDRSEEHTSELQSRPHLV